MKRRLPHSPQRIATKAGPPGLGPLVRAVFFLDVLFCLLRLYLCLRFVLNIQARDFGIVGLAFLCLCAGIAVSGLSADILILRRKRRGVPFAVTAIVLGTISLCFSLWQPATPPLGFSELVVVVPVAIGGWLVAYSIAVLMAATEPEWLQKDTDADDPEKPAIPD